MNYLRKSYYSLMFFIAYAFKGQVHVFAGRVKILSHSPCRTSAIFNYFCSLFYHVTSSMMLLCISIVRLDQQAHLTTADPEIFARGGPNLKFFFFFFFYLLAHLSRRLMGELIVYQSLRRPSVRPSTFSNIFSSATIGPIKLKFHMETP